MSREPASLKPSPVVQRERGWAPVAGLIAAVLVAGCGQAVTSRSASSVSTSSSSATTRATAPRRRPARSAARATGAPLGTTRLVRAGRTRLLVTMGPVLDPLAGSGAALPPGTRAVGVVLTVHNDGGGTYDSTASGDVSLSTSAGPAAPLFVRAGRCATPLTDFESLIGAGETRHGCVGFSVGGRSRVIGVRFSPHSRAPGSVAWR